MTAGGKKMLLVEESVGTCAFCGRRLSSASGPDTYGLVHDLPTCETFNRLDVPKFVRASATKLGLSPGSGEEN